jgi:predicted nucleotidyltransferase
VPRPSVRPAQDTTLKRPDSSAERQRFTAALDRLVETLREDRSVLAAILCGSLSHDAVWAKSDIDLVLVTIDDKKVPATTRALYADGVNVHAWLMPRASFRRIVEGSVRNSFVHSFLTKGRLLYTHDETITDLFAGLSTMGERDRQMELLRAAAGSVGSLYKAHKFLNTRGDLEYTTFWILDAATGLARIEVISAGLLADREVIPQASTINPAFFGTVYTELLNEKKTRQAVDAALAAADEYLGSRATSLFAPIIEHLLEVGEPRSATELEHHFERNYDVGGVMTACEYLADQGLIGKASISVRLTKRSNVDVEELAFFAITSPPDRF